MELAAWTATESEALLTHLLAHDPEALLRTDVSAIREAHRVALVEGVIAKATAGQLFDTQGLDRFFHTLNHPMIAEQLRPILRDRTRNLVARRIAFDIATACEAIPLLDDVLAIMVDQRERGVHSAATAALVDLTTPEQAPQLVAFLKRRRSQPLSAQVRFALVRTLLKRGTWSITEALPHVERALRTHDMSGVLLAQFAQPSDAEALLRACLRWRGCADPLSRAHAFLQAAHDHGLARIAEPRIRWLMARVWWQVQKDYRAEGFTGTKEKTGPNLHQQLRADRTLRRQFIDDVVSFPSAWVKNHLWRLVEILSAADFSWLLTRAVICSRRRQPIYSQLAARAYICEQHAAHWDELLEGLARSADLRAAFSWLRIWPLNAPETQKQKHDYYESQKWSQRPRPTVEPKPEPAEVWQRDLENLASGTPTVWLNLAHNLFYRIDREAGAEEQPHDVRTSPGWSFHSQDARDCIIAGARRLLREVPGNPHHPIGSQSRFDELAYRALYLLKDEIVRTPELADTVRRHWLPIIFDEFSNADPHHLEMMAIGYHLDGVTMRTLLREKILRYSAQESGYCYTLREFASCWDQPLANFVIDLCANEITNPTTLGCVMDHLAGARTRLRMGSLAETRRHVQHRRSTIRRGHDVAGELATL